jgi:hypothetical protein
LAASQFFAFVIVNSSAKVAGVAFAALWAAGAVVQPLRERLERMNDWVRPSARSCQSVQVTGFGLSAAMLGGLRALVADGLWLKTYQAWAACDLPATERLIRLVTMVDDRPVYFWLNGARIMAYDMTEWRRAAHARDRGSAADGRRIVEEQAETALGYLADAHRRHPSSAAVCVETANIHLYRRGDLVSAAEWYQRAAGLPDAPYYAARIHGELLRRLGREREAYLLLCRLHPSLPANDPEAMAEVVLRRIRGLEEALNIPEGDRYRPVSGSAEDRDRKR